MPDDTDVMEPVEPNEGHVEMHGPNGNTNHPSGSYEPVQVNQQFVQPRANEALGLRGLWGVVGQFGAIGFLMVAFGFGGHYLLTTAKELQTSVLQDFRDARKEDKEERSADRERTLKLAEAIVRLEESHNRQNAVMSQQADSMSRLAVAMERLKLTTKMPAKKDPDHDTPEPAPMPRGCP